MVSATLRHANKPAMTLTSLHTYSHHIMTSTCTRAVPWPVASILTLFTVAGSWAQTHIYTHQSHCT